LTRLCVTEIAEETGFVAAFESEAAIGIADETNFLAILVSVCVIVKVVEADSE
jgi:hypothetical protein